MFTIRQLAQDALEEEVDQTVTAIHEAFQRKFFSPGCGSEENSFLCVRAHVIAGISDGIVYVAEKPDMGIVGGTVWFPPQRRFLGNDEQLKIWDSFKDHLADEQKSFWSRLIDQYNQFCEDSFGPGNKLASWHLQLAGVMPAHQKQGITKRFFETIFEYVIRDKTILTVETAGEINVHVYKSYGCQIAGSRELQPGEDIINMFCLSWKPDPSIYHDSGATADSETPAEE